MFTCDPKWYFVSPWKSVCLYYFSLRAKWNITRWEVSKYGVFSDTYFSCVSLNTGNKEQKKLGIWRLFMQCVISLWGSSDWNMLEATMQIFIEEVLCCINTVADKNFKFLIIWQKDLTTNVADFKLLSKWLQRQGKTMSIYDYFILDDTSFKGAVSGLRQFLATESHLEMMKNSFYFTSKALKTFKFLSLLFGHVLKRLD